eukprot:SAG31_NODE_3116_length_4658_cov_2.625576_7_plen_77_part_00
MHASHTVHWLEHTAPPHLAQLLHLSPNLSPRTFPRPVARSILHHHIYRVHFGGMREVVHMKALNSVGGSLFEHYYT